MKKLLKTFLFNHLGHHCKAMMTLIVFTILIDTAFSQENCKNHFDSLIKVSNDVPKANIKLDFDQYVEELKILAQQYPTKVRISEYGHIGRHSLFKLHIPSGNPNAFKVVITSGIHGNELLAPLAAKLFLNRFLENPELSSKIDLTIYPTMSPLGLEAGTRRVRNEVDLNRVFTSDSSEPEVQLFAKDLQSTKFDLALDLHGGPSRKQFFVIRSSEDQDLALDALKVLPDELVLESDSKVYPGFVGIPSDPQRYTFTSRGVGYSKNGGTVKSFMFQEQSIPLSYTLEYPGAIDPEIATLRYVDLIESFISVLANRETDISSKHLSKTYKS